MQQRGIPEQIVKKIVTYGSSRRVAGSAIARFISNKDLKGIFRFVTRRERIRLDRHKSVYVVMADDHIIIVGHRTKRFFN